VCLYDAGAAHGDEHAHGLAQMAGGFHQPFVRRQPQSNAFSDEPAGVWVSGYLHRTPNPVVTCKGRHNDTDELLREWVKRQSSPFVSSVNLAST
jgi:hypothetical protein